MLFTVTFYAKEKVEKRITTELGFTQKLLAICHVKKLPTQVFSKTAPFLYSWK